MIDRYTKVVLTVIAVALSISALHTLNLIGSANAFGINLQRVVICDPYGRDAATTCTRVDRSKLATSG